MKIWLAEIWRAWRASLRRPGFLLLASGVLALGIGASVAVFTLIDQVLMQSLPLPDASRVLVVGPLHGSQHRPGAISPQQYQHLQPLEGVAALGLARSGQQINISSGGGPQVVSATYIDHGLLPALGLQPALGRNFSASEDQPDGPHVVMLSHGLWQRAFAGDSTVLGQTMQVKGRSYTIIGVLPRSFDSLSFSGDVALPIAMPANTRNDGTNFIAVARLAEGANRAAVAAQVDAHLHAMYAGMPDYEFGKYWLRQHFGVQEISAWQHSAARGKLTLFMACALFVLLTALVNLINLMLLRSLSRTHEHAVRAALGAPPSRLALPALAEGMLIGMLGAVLGTCLAALGLGLLRRLVSAEWLPTGGLHIGPTIWVLSLIAAIIVAMLAATFGVWRSQRTITSDELREGGRGGMGRHSGRLGRVLVVAQMMLATVLLCSTGLLLHGLYLAARTPLGFSSEHILAFDLAPLRVAYPDAESVQVLSQRVVRKLAAIPGVTTAVATTNLPSGTRREQFNLSVHGPGGQPTPTQFRGIDPAFFRLFDIPLHKGRTFTQSDVRDGEAVAIVSQSLAEHMFAGHALDKTIERGSGAQRWSARIVGVVGDTLQFGPLHPAPDILYVPLAQMQDQALAAFRSFFPMRFVLRGHGDAQSWRAGVRAALRDVAPDQPISNFRSMDQVVRSTTADTRQTLLLIGIFAALALLLATAGMYAVMAVAVTAREREFGVRVALGAKPTRLVRLVLRSGLTQIMIGLVLGVGVVLAASHWLQGMLMDLIARSSSFDPVALVAVCVALAMAGLLACLLPALRAARVQPMHALRGE